MNTKLEEFRSRFPVRTLSRESVIIHSNMSRGEYFFSTDHCQGVYAKETYPKEEGWVPTTFHLPQTVVPRESLPSGLVETAADVITIFFSDSREIPNPDPKYQPSVPIQSL